MNDQNSLNQINQFKFVKQLSISKNQKLKTLITNAEEKKLKPNIYFTTTLKELLKYKEKKKEDKEKIEQKRRFKYLKTRSEIINYKDCHEIKDNYKDQYQEKDLYTAILIPDSGSWVRLSFQKNTEINKYKYPIKNQEDEIIIQLDKFTQKPIIHLLKEMGLTDLEICKNLNHADFFYFNKPLITNLTNDDQPLLRFD